jgi:parallel beta-helix repeat protein
MVLTAVFVITPLSVQAQGAGTGKVIVVPGDHRTVQAALDHADAGDTIFVTAGTYRGAITLREYVALIGAGAERTILVGDRRNPVIRGAQGATVRHFTIEGGYQGILCSNTFMVIEDNVIRGNRETGIHCIIALPVIRNNIILRNRGTGIFCETTRAHRGLIANNVIAESGRGGVMLAGQSEVLVENNIFYFNGQHGIFVSEGARRSRIANNLFYGNRGAGNSVAVIDQSNVFDDPGAKVVMWDETSNVLRGRGREGTDIGLLRRAFFTPAAR